MLRLSDLFRALLGTESKAAKVAPRVNVTDVLPSEEKSQHSFNDLQGTESEAVKVAPRRNVIDVLTSDEMNQHSFFVSCWVPESRSSDDPPNSHDTVLAAFEGVEEAVLILLHREHHLLPMCGVGDGDFQTDYRIEPTRANVLALKSTGLDWTEDAERLAASFSISDGELQQARAATIVRAQQIADWWS